MTSPITTPGWNATAGSNSTSHLQGTHETTRNRTADRLDFYKNNYDEMTGLRIAGTLGGFFFIVLATILYKSKCKKHSREPSPVPMPMDLGALKRPVHHSLHTPRSSIINTSMLEYAGYGVSANLNANPAANVDFTPYMNQVNHMYFNSPAVLLTAANSESSEEDLPFSGFLVGGGGAGGGRGLQLQHQEQQYQQRGPSVNLRKMKGSNNYYGDDRDRDSPTNKMKCLKQSIDIHVILPTPTISPSSSENFTRVRMKKDQELLIYDDCLSVNESESEMSALAPPPGGALFSLENLKYVDDTSSENIPTRTSDFDDQDDDSRRSIGSDSVFACYDSEYGPAISIIPPPPPPPPLTPPPAKRESRERRSARRNSKSVSMRDNYNFSNSSSFYDNEDDDDCECRMTLTEAQVHRHRDSCCGSDLESCNDYMESHRRRSSSTQTTLSDLRRCLVTNVGSIGSNASSQSQSRHSPNPFPNLSPYINFSSSCSSAATGVTSPTTPHPSHPYFPTGSIPIPVPISMIPVTSFLSHSPGSLAHSPPDSSILLRVTPVGSFNSSRKRSFETLKNTDSLRCDCDQQSNQMYM